MTHHFFLNLRISGKKSRVTLCEELVQNFESNLKLYLLSISHVLDEFGE